MKAYSSRKRSPRAPSITLEEAIDRVRNVYDAVRVQPAPTDAIAKHMGYKGANNGAALQALASARYFGLLERLGDGHLCVTEAFEQFWLARGKQQRKALLIHFLRNPPLYSDLLDRYKNLTASVETVRSNLVERGFNPIAAEVALTVFLKSAEYVDYNWDEDISAHAATLPIDGTDNSENMPMSATARLDAASGQTPLAASAFASFSAMPTPLWLDAGTDSIPVRLSGGRKAWLAIPTPLYADDKLRLKAQIDLLLAQDEG